LVSAAAVEISDRAHGLTGGADAYLADPAEPEELLATVAATLGYYRARQRAERTTRLLAELTNVTACADGQLARTRWFRRAPGW
jgi:DNA-binding response OmpR family regulator